jgi:glycosyltransferase involved in cell wall biosynthesis
MPPPLVSIILPTYNRAHLLKRSIQSILNQTYKNFELIIVNDGSTDNTREVVENFHDRRIYYVEHEKRRGANAARNTGIKLAKGEYIAFQDDDDIWLPRKLEMQIEVFQNSPQNVGVVYTGCLRIDCERGRAFRLPSIKEKRVEGYIHSNLLKKNFITTTTAVVKRECFQHSGLFDENLPRLQEWDLWIRISKHYSFKYINLPLVISYIFRENISRNLDALISAQTYILYKYFDEISHDLKMLAHHYAVIGSLLHMRGKIKEGRKYLLRGFSRDSTNFRIMSALLFSYLFPEAYKKYLNWRITL